MRILREGRDGEQWVLGRTEKVKFEAKHLHRRDTSLT